MHVDLALGITFGLFFVFLQESIPCAVHKSDLLLLFVLLEFMNVHLLHLGLDLHLRRRMWR